MSEKLKLCPFCGTDEVFVGKSIVSKYYVCCISGDNCYIKTTAFDTEKDAIEAWNRRVNN